MNKQNLRLFFIAALLAVGSFLPAQNENKTDEIQKDEIRTDIIRWYRSNSSGMSLELIPSQQAVMRYEFYLSERNALSTEVPRFLLQYYDDSYLIELRILYENGEERRRQWVFRDENGISRFTASGNGERFGGIRSRKVSSGGEDPDDAEKTGGIIEIKNEEGVVIREFQYAEDLSEWDYRYNYRDGILVRTEIWFKEPPPEDLPSRDRVFVRVYTDSYRYSRSGSIRAIDRTVHVNTADSGRIRFPRLGLAVPLGERFVDKSGAYTSEYFTGVKSPEGAKITFNLDNRGRILGEVWRDEAGTLLGELKNNWSGERLKSVLWKSGDDERLFEFEYDSEGNRIAERNYNKGVLERGVTFQDDGLEIEEIYMNGRMILRAFWRNGEKISEERVSPERVRP